MKCVNCRARWSGEELCWLPIDDVDSDLDTNRPIRILGSED